MKKFRKIFGETPEEVVVMRTKVFFNAEGIAEVEDEEVIAVLEAVPGYEVVSEGESEGNVIKTPETSNTEPTDTPTKADEQEEEPADENPADEPTSEEDSVEEGTSEVEEDEETEDAPKPIKAPRAPRRPSAPKK